MHPGASIYSSGRLGSRARWIHGYREPARDGPWGGYLPDREQRYAEARRFIGIALTVALVDLGGEMRGDLGDPVTCAREAETIEPFALVAKFQSGELTPLAGLVRET